MKKNLSDHTGTVILKNGIPLQSEAPYELFSERCDSTQISVPLSVRLKPAKVFQRKS